MTFWDKARQAAAAAAVTAKETAGVAGAGVKGAAGIAKISASAAVDRINPNSLADLIIKATTIQERTNAALRDKRSAYRVAEIAITAAFPPQISFSIARIGDVNEEPGMWAAHLAAEAAQADAVAAQLQAEAAPGGAPGEAPAGGSPEAWAHPGAEAWQQPAEPGWGETAVTEPLPAATDTSPGGAMPAEVWPPSDGWQEATEGWETTKSPPSGEPPTPDPESR